MKKSRFIIAWLLALQLIPIAICLSQSKSELDSLLVSSFSVNDKEAEKITRQVMADAARINYREVMIKAQNELGNLLTRDGQLDSANYFLTQSVAQSKAYNLEQELASAYVHLSVLYRTQSRNDKAQQYIDSAIYLNEKIGNDKKLALSLKEKGNIYVSLGDYPNAQKFLYRAVDLFKKQQDHFNISLTMSVITTVNTYLTDYNTARETNLEALRYATLSGDSSALNRIYSNFGLIYRNMKLFDSAIYYHQQSILIQKEKGNKLGEAINLQNIANIYRERGAYQKALEIANEALVIKKEIGNIRSQLFTDLLIGDIYRSKGDYNQAIERNLKALEVARSNKVLDRERVALLYLSQCYKSTKDFENAYQYHIAYTSLQDSMFNIAKSEQIAEMRTRYEITEKENQISLQKAQISLDRNIIKQKDFERNLLIAGVIVFLLITIVFYYQFKKIKQSNTLLKEQKDIIEQKSEERKILLKEIHHRVKNNLQIISSLLNIQSRSLKDENAVRAIKEGQSRIKSMALIHQKLYGSDNLSKIDMKDYIEQLSDFLFSSFRPVQDIERTIDINETYLDVNTAVPIGLIINELISNSYKYAFNSIDYAGKLSVSLTKNDIGKYELLVADNGSGISQDFDPEESDSLGLSLVYSLTEQIQGTIQLKSNVGTQFRIEFNDKLVA